MGIGGVNLRAGCGGTGYHSVDFSAGNFVWRGERGGGGNGVMCEGERIDLVDLHAH